VIPSKWNGKDTDFIMIAIIGIKDNLRNNIKETIQQIKDAGINLRLISTESKNTTIAAAKEAGLLP